jgi:hypothetical protein
MSKKLIDVENVNAVVFFEFPLAPIAEQHQQSLYKHLLENVWGVYRSPTEDIRVCNNLWLRDGDIDEIRYQIDLESAEDRFGEIAELIEQEVKIWFERMGGYEAVCA